MDRIHSNHMNFVQPHRSQRKEQTMTQCERILRYIDEHGSITAKEAMNELGIMRLASRIADLKADGWEIDTTTECSMNRYGEKTHYAKYSMGGRS